MFSVNAAEFHILVVGDVMSCLPWLDNMKSTSPDMLRYVTTQKLGHGGAANAARVVAETGVAVGLLCVNDANEMAQHNLLTQFNALLPQYDVIVLSDYPKSLLENLKPMVASARHLGKRILIEPHGEDFSPFIGASLLTPHIDLLRHVVDGWRDEQELTRKVQKMLIGLELGGLIVNRDERGISLYIGQHVSHFPTMNLNGCNSLIAAVATMLKAGRSIQTAVSMASDSSHFRRGNLRPSNFPTEELRA